MIMATILLLLFSGVLLVNNSLQVCYGKSSSGTTVKTTFPLAFSSCVRVIASSTVGNTGNTKPDYWITSSLTDFTHHKYDATVSNYIAIGY